MQALMLTLIFFIAGVNKIFNFNGVLQDFHTKISYLPKFISKIIILFVILIEIICPIIIICFFFTLHFKNFAHFAIVLLMVFTILATLLYHIPINFNQLVKFLYNISLLGGLWLLIEEI